MEPTVMYSNWIAISRYITSWKCQGLQNKDKLNFPDVVFCILN